MEIKLFTIPNLLTLSNLLCGAAATVAALSFGALDVAFGLILLAAVFDFFDGFAARLLGVSSPIGLQLDSLADDISFGLAPSASLFALYGRMPGLWLPSGWPGLAVFLFAAFAALRLARFNIDDTQRDEFRGLPSPAAAMFVASLGYLACACDVTMPREAVLLAGLLAAVLMISPVRMFALKFHGFGLRGNELRYGFLLVSAVLLLLLGVRAVPAIIALYVLVSFVRWLLPEAKGCGKGR